MMPDVDISTDRVMRAYIDDMITQKGVANIDQDQRARLRQKLFKIFDERVQDAMIAALPDDKLIELDEKLNRGISDDDLGKFFDDAGVDFDEVAERALEQFRNEYLSGELEVEVPAPREMKTGVDGKAEFEAMMMHDDEIVNEPEGAVSVAPLADVSAVKVPENVAVATKTTVAASENAGTSVEVGNVAQSGSMAKAEAVTQPENATQSGSVATEIPESEPVQEQTDLEKAIQEAEATVKGIVTPLNGAVSIGKGIVLPDPVAVPDDPEEAAQKAQVQADQAMQTSVEQLTQVQPQPQVTPEQGVQPMMQAQANDITVNLNGGVGQNGQ